MNWPKIREELELRTSRSSGAGGQHVNKTESRVDANGRISVVDQSGRSQHTNRKRALLRLKEMLERGSRPIPKPHKGKAFVANKRKRLDWKKRRGEIKASRGKKWY